MKEAIFMLGLPGSGKTKLIESKLSVVNSCSLGKIFILQENQYVLVSADEIRLNHPDYDPEHPELIHEECVKLAKEKVFEVAERGFNLVMDGGGINNNYTVNIIAELKKLDYHIKVVFINTPVEVCIERNQYRYEYGERFVKADAIIDKAYKLQVSVVKLKLLADEFEQVDYFTDSHIFVDLDGTLAEYQNLQADTYGNIDFVQYSVFLKGKPVKEVIEKIKKLSDSGKEIYVVSASPNSIANNEKMEWLYWNANFIKMENIYFVGNRKYKHVFLQQLIKKLKLNVCDCMVVDDDHQVLEKYKSIGVNSVHPSKLLSNY